MAFTAVSKFVTTLKDHTTASVLMVMNSTVMVTHVQVRNKLIKIGPYQNYLKLPDIDECLTGVEQCDQNCENDLGSYACSCDSGFILNVDGYCCDGKQFQSFLLRPNS